MANIKQQKRRIDIAARQRLENLRWSSTAKTLQRRLARAVDDGDDETIAAEHRNLVRWLDRAAAKGAIHPNKAGRRKSQAARLVASAKR